MGAHRRPPADPHSHIPCTCCVRNVPPGDRTRATSLGLNCACLFSTRSNSPSRKGMGAVSETADRTTSTPSGESRSLASSKFGA